MTDEELTRLESLSNIVSKYDTRAQVHANAPFVIPAVNALPALIAEVRRLRLLWDAVEVLGRANWNGYGWSIHTRPEWGTLAAALIALAAKVKEGE